MFTFFYKQVTVNLFKTGLLLDAYFKKTIYWITKSLFFTVSLIFIEKYFLLHIYNQGKKTFYTLTSIWDVMRRYTTYQLISIAIFSTLLLLYLVI